MQPMNVIERIINADEGSELAQAMAQRAEIFRLSQASHDALVIPREPGGFSHGERAALAERIARFNNDDALAEHYRVCLENAGSNPGLLAIADPASISSQGERLDAVVRFADLVTRHPRDATRADIDSLKQVGLSEPDIVRLTELLAFVNYQLRVVAGLRIARSAR